VIFTYESDESQLKQNKQIMSIDLGFKKLATCTKNRLMWFFIMNKAASHRHVMLT